MPDKGSRLCHQPAMRRSSYSQAGGFILAVSIVAGSVAGAIVRQSSIGFLVGLGVGVLLALLIWIADLRRT
jgi:hypothetical protein